MENPILVVDVNQWQVDVDFALLKRSGVSGVILAFNIYTGDLELTPTFVTQYNQAYAAGLAVFAYMVYKPTIAAQDYMTWVSKNLPSTSKAILVDTEVRMTGYSASLYGSHHAELMSLLKTRWNAVVYTGAGYSDILSPWPKDVPYWWAYYVSRFYPAEKQSWTWDQVRNALLDYSIPPNALKVPGLLLLWQFTGDKLIMPGCKSPLDISVFYGTMDELISLAGNGGGEVIVTPPIPVDQPTLVLEETWFGRVNYKHFNVTKVRPNIGSDNVDYHVLRFNVADLEDIYFDYLNGRAETTWFVSHHDVDFAINGLDGFVGDYITGFAAYHGMMRGKLGVEQTLFVDKNFGFSLTKPASVWNACSFPNLLVQNGQPYPVNKSLDDIRARTAIGKSQDGNEITIIIVDGGDYMFHHGFNFQETRQLLIDEKCWLGVMADGGGSTTLVKKVNGIPVIVGKPSGENVSGQRSVAVHMGFKVSNPIIAPPPTPITLSGVLKIDGYNPINVRLE